MPNPKGNPESLKPHKLTTDRDEPLTSKLTVRITKSMENELNELGDEKADFVREAIQEKLDERDKTKAEDENNKSK